MEGYKNNRRLQTHERVLIILTGEAMKHYNVIAASLDGTREIIGEISLEEYGSDDKDFGKKMYAAMDAVAEVGKKVYPEWRVGEYNRGLVEMCVYEDVPGGARKIHKRTLYKEEK